MWREWIEMSDMSLSDYIDKSPSVWREWIEIAMISVYTGFPGVSLRVEGVD